MVYGVLYPSKQSPKSISDKVRLRMNTFVPLLSNLGCVAIATQVAVLVTIASSVSIKRILVRIAR